MPKTGPSLKFLQTVQHLGEGETAGNLPAGREWKASQQGEVAIHTIGVCKCG